MDLVKTGLDGNTNPYRIADLPACMKGERYEFVNEYGTAVRKLLVAGVPARLPRGLSRTGRCGVRATPGERDVGALRFAGTGEVGFGDGHG
ncbi:hypothetical protein [Amycolatopsis rubida]|uniref:Uncharacterized protein n=1 Tax=Amycolatopsis rubida TaxID=112413 RepID=A0A1I5VJG9_9PSEU|nr:hypothetical protein [Amycolatopsis rubida]SFQ07655.1 hypothetical protein SAMN05421854_108382 [Amycolatopsis rubida]